MHRIHVVIIVILGIVAAVATSCEENANHTSSPTQQPAGQDVASAEPTPDATLDSTPEPSLVPAFADILLSGTGDGVPRFEIPVDTPAIADITHTGASTFAIFSIGEDGSPYWDELVNTIGNYSGTVLFDETISHSVAFEVTADGAWTIMIRPITAADSWDGIGAVSGPGDDVIHVNPPIRGVFINLFPPIRGLVRAEITHTGAANFAVVAYGSGLRRPGKISPTGFGADLLVNAIGNYSGESVIGAGTVLIEITADGAWTITRTRVRGLSR